MNRNSTIIKIYTNNYCINIAENLKTMISKHFGIFSAIVPKRFDKIDRDRLKNHEYVIIFHGTLWHQPLEFPPPPNRYFLYQLEQLNKEEVYKKNVEPILYLIERSICTFDYSLTNLNYYPKNIRHKIKYLIPPPFSYPTRLQNISYDILFYGCFNSRRKAILDYISSKGYKVCIVSDVFGKDLRNLILKSRIILNLHAYTEAILEIPRIHEAVHTNARIISEYPCTEDWKETPEYVKNRIFFIELLEENLSNISCLIDAIEAQDTSKEELPAVAGYLNNVNPQVISMLEPIKKLI